MCSRSAVNTGRPLIRRRSTERTVSKIGRPKETTGMATATIVGDFWAPCRASALRMKPMNRLPQSPSKIVAGLKLDVFQNLQEPDTSHRAGTRSCGPDARDRQIPELLSGNDLCRFS